MKTKKIQINSMSKTPALSFVVITSLSCLFVTSYSSSSQHHAGLYDKEALMYVWGAPSER